MKKILSLVLIFDHDSGNRRRKIFTNEIANIVHKMQLVIVLVRLALSLTNYMEVKSYGETIKWVTGSRYMPPWKADPQALPGRKLPD